MGGIEQPQIGKCFAIAAGIARKRDDVHATARLVTSMPHDRIVIHEHERVETEPELSRQLTEVL